MSYTIIYSSFFTLCLKFAPIMEIKFVVHAEHFRAKYVVRSREKGINGNPALEGFFKPFESVIFDVRCARIFCWL